MGDTGVSWQRLQLPRRTAEVLRLHREQPPHDLLRVAGVLAGEPLGGQPSGGHPRPALLAGGTAEVVLLPQPPDRAVPPGTPGVGGPDLLDGHRGPEPDDHARG
jgi:hypothetical protein